MFESFKGHKPVGTCLQVMAYSGDNLPAIIVVLFLYGACHTPSELAHTFSGSCNAARNTWCARCPYSRRAHVSH